MNTARPMVSKTQSAGSGMRPKVGRTERSHPKTRPMMSAPPLAVRLSGRPPIVDDQQAEQAAEEDAEADEDDVGLARRPLHVPERPPGPLDVRRGAGDAEQVAAVEHGGRPRRDLLAAADELQENHAAAVLGRDLGQRAVRDPRCVSTTSSGRPAGSRAARGPRPRRRRAPGASEHAVGACDDHDVAAAQDCARARRRSTSPPRRIRSTKTRVGREGRLELGHAAPGQRASASAKGAHVPLAVGRTATVASPAAISRLPRAARLSALRLNSSSRGARLERNHTTKPVPTR